MRQDDIDTDKLPVIDPPYKDYDMSEDVSEVTFRWRHIQGLGAAGFHAGLVLAISILAWSNASVGAWALLGVSTLGFYVTWFTEFIWRVLRTIWRV